MKHWGNVTRRGVDDLQDLGGRGLLLQRLACLVQEPRVLHRDDRLRGEVLQQGDLLVRKRPHLLPVRKQGTEKLVTLTQRDPDTGPGAKQLDCCNSESVAPSVRLVFSDVDNMHNRLATSEAPKCRKG